MTEVSAWRVRAQETATSSAGVRGHPRGGGTETKTAYFYGLTRWG